MYLKSAKHLLKYLSYVYYFVNGNIHFLTHNIYFSYTSETLLYTCLNFINIVTKIAP